MNNVLTTRAKFGISLQEVDALDSVGQNTGLNYKQQLSEIQGLDYAKAITNFKWNFSKNYLTITLLKLKIGPAIFYYVTTVYFEKIKADRDIILNSMLPQRNDFV